MLPAVLLTTRTPFSTTHFAGDLSLVATHWSRLRPSNSTMASDGGAGSVAPGVTTGGTGVHCSVSCGLALGSGDGTAWAMALAAVSSSRPAAPAAIHPRRQLKVPSPCG